MRSSRPELFCKNGVLANFAKLTRKHQKDTPLQMFSCEFCEISHKIFLKEPFGRLLLHKHSFCLLSQHDLLPFQKQCHTYFRAEYFLGLIVDWEQDWAQYFKPLARSLFSTQSSICDGVSFAKIVSSLSIFAKKLHCRCSTRFSIPLCKWPLKGVKVKN